MPQELTAVIIDTDNEAREAIQGFIKPHNDRIKICCSLDNFKEGLQIIQAVHPYIVILGVNELNQGVEQVQTILSRFPRTSIFITTLEKDPDWILRLMRAGADEYLLKPIDKNDLFEAFQKVGKLLLSGNNGAGEAEGKIIAVFNPAGGAGTTTVAVNLAAAMKKNDNKIALVDLNFFSGDVATFLDVTPRYTLSSVTSNMARLDASFMMSVMTQHSSGVYILSEPLDVDETLMITPEQIQRVLAILKKVFSYIVIDTGGHLSGANEMVFAHADRILFNTVLSLPSLHNAKRYLSAMDKREMNREKIKIVVNRYISKSDIKIQDMEKILGRPVFSMIPNEYVDVIDSINKGVPVVTHLPNSPVSRAIFKLAEMLMG